jgi:hypothetical protein
MSDILAGFEEAIAELEAEALETIKDKVLSDRVITNAIIDDLLKSVAAGAQGSISYGTQLHVMSLVYSPPWGWMFTIQESTFTEAIIATHKDSPSAAIEDAYRQAMERREEEE